MPKAKLLEKKPIVETNGLAKKKPGRKPKPKDEKQQTLPRMVGMGSTNSSNSHIGRSVGLTIYSSLFYEQYSHIENSCWAILPPSVLDRFQNELFDRADKSNNNACFKIMNGELEIYVCALEFTANEKEIVIPVHLLDYLAIEPGSQVVITLVDPPQASNMKLMPLDREFFEVEDTLDLLESSIKNHYKVLVEGQTIQCRYFDIDIPLKIVSLDPYYVCRTNETDLNIDFVENPELQPKSEEISNSETRVNSWDTNVVEENYFSKLGMGNSMTSNDISTKLSADEIRRKRLEKLANR